MVTDAEMVMEGMGLPVFIYSDFVNSVTEFLMRGDTCCH